MTMKCESTKGMQGTIKIVWIFCGSGRLRLFCGGIYAAGDDERDAFSIGIGRVVVKCVASSLVSDSMV